MAGENIKQVYNANPITSNTSTDLMYFGQSPYGITNDAAMLYSNFAAQFILKDANGNASANSFLAGYATTATAAATTTLTVASKYQQYFTGSTTQTVLLPVTSTLVLGQSFYIVNNSSGVVTVESSGGNSIQAMSANSWLLVTCILTSGTSAASWNFEYGLQSPAGASPWVFGVGTGSAIGGDGTSTAIGTDAISYGSGNHANADYSIAIGQNNTIIAGALYSVAMGHNHNISSGGTYSAVFGNSQNCQAQGCFMAGQSNTIEPGADHATAIGYGIDVLNAGSFIISDSGGTPISDTAANQFVATFANGYYLWGGSLSVSTIGKGLKVAEGSNAKQGIATLVGGTVTVSNTSVTANSRIFLTIQSPGGTLGSVYIASRIAATSFTISSTSAIDTSDVAYFITEPA